MKAFRRPDPTRSRREKKQSKNSPPR